MIRIHLTPVTDFAALGTQWRALEQRSDPSFFQSWTWLGCLAEERFDRPMLLEARADGCAVALALFNRRRGRLFLGETGDRDWDSLFIEHNGILVARDHAGLVDACAGYLAARRMVLSGVGDAHLAAARSLPGQAYERQTRRAPFVDFAALPPAPYTDSLSANTRYQLRRSDRRYAAHGALGIERARTEAEARAFLAALAGLHQRTWEERGQPGAFASPAFARFHHALIERGFAAGETDLLRITSGSSVVGYLYNFVHRGQVSAYQSGFDYTGAQPHEKPGLTCHRLAIELYRALGMTRYDFLAGDDRYKASLANASTTLHWLDYLPRYSAAWLAAGAHRLLRRARRTVRAGSANGAEALQRRHLAP